MRTLVLTFALTFVLFTFTEAVDPAKFQCRKNSPTGGDIFSDDYPPVNLVHIFCGQINSYGQATGFHSRPNGNDPTCTRTELYILVQLSREIDNCTYWYNYQEKFLLSSSDHANHNTMYWSGHRYLLYYYRISVWNGYQRSTTQPYGPRTWQYHMLLAPSKNYITLLHLDKKAKSVLKISLTLLIVRSLHDVVIIVQYGEVTTAYPGNCSKMAEAQIYKYDHNYYQHRHSELQPIH